MEPGTQQLDSTGIRVSEETQSIGPGPAAGGVTDGSLEVSLLRNAMPLPHKYKLTTITKQKRRSPEVKQ